MILRKSSEIYLPTHLIILKTATERYNEFVKRKLSTILIKNSGTFHKIQLGYILQDSTRVHFTRFNLGTFQKIQIGNISQDSTRVNFTRFNSGKFHKIQPG